jgi:hypothetical protein
MNKSAPKQKGYDIGRNMRNHISLRVRPLANSNSNKALGYLINTSFYKPVAYLAKLTVKALPILPIAGGVYSTVVRATTQETSYYPDTFSEIAMLVAVIQDFMESLNIAIEYAALSNDVKTLINRKQDISSILKLVERDQDLLNTFYDYTARPIAKKLSHDPFIASNIIKVVTIASLCTILAWQLSSIKSLDNNHNNNSANIQMTIADCMAIGIMCIYLFVERFSNLKSKQLAQIDKLDQLFTILISDEAPELMSNFASTFLSTSAQTKIADMINFNLSKQLSNEVEGANERTYQASIRERDSGDNTSDNSAIKRAAEAAAASAGMPPVRPKNLGELLDEYMALDNVDDSSQEQSLEHRTQRKQEIRETIKTFSHINSKGLSNEQEDALANIKGIAELSNNNSVSLSINQASDNDPASLMEEGIPQPESTPSDSIE